MKRRHVAVPRTTRRCQLCGAEHERAEPAVYCSKECSRLAANARWRSYHPTPQPASRPCHVCGTAFVPMKNDVAEFRPKTSSGHPTKYCSVTCGNRAANARRPRRPPRVRRTYEEKWLRQVAYGRDRIMIAGERMYVRHLPGEVQELARSIKQVRRELRIGRYDQLKGH